jgi:hypothetical protein
VGGGVIAPRIVDLGTRWRWVVSFTPQPLYPQVKSSWYTLDRRLGGPQSRSGRGGEEKNSQPPPGIEPYNTDRPVRSPALYRLSYHGSHLIPWDIFFFEYIEKQNEIRFLISRAKLFWSLFWDCDVYIYFCISFRYFRVYEGTENRKRINVVIPHRESGAKWKTVAHKNEWSYQRMSGAIPPLPQYASMVWCSIKSTGTTLPSPFTFINVEW